MLYYAIYTSPQNIPESKSFFSIEDAFQFILKRSEKFGGYKDASITKTDEFGYSDTENIVLQMRLIK